MKSAMRCQVLTAAIAATALLYSSNLAFAEVGDVSMVAIHGGTATFDVATNVPAISMHGKSTALEGSAHVRVGGDSLVIEQLEAVLPIRTLSTGIGLRDEHMRKYVFTTADGTLSDVRFVAERVVCSGSGGPKDTCQLSGDLIIRGTARPFVIALDVKREGDSFRAVGDGVAKLSAYGIAAPSQLGVSVMDTVRLHVAFVVKRVEERIARGTDR